MTVATKLYIYADLPLATTGVANIINNTPEEEIYVNVTPFDDGVALKFYVITIKEV